MELIVFLAALASAALHAGWNAGVKVSASRDDAMAAVVVGCGLVSLPLLAAVPLPDIRALPWMGLAVIANLAALKALSLAYRFGDFALAYPLARGGAPLVVAGLSTLLIAEPATPLMLAGIAAISTGMVILALEGRRRGGGGIKAVVPALLSALLIGCYSFIDAMGVRQSGSAAGYGLMVSVLNGCMFAVTQGVRRRNPITLVTRQWRIMIFAVPASITSYLLILWAMTQAPVPLVAALRETSVLFATLFAAFILKERVGAWRWLAAAAVVGGIALLRLA